MYEPRRSMDVLIHTRDVCKLGETEQRIYLMTAWRETSNVFSEEELLLRGMRAIITINAWDRIGVDLWMKSGAIGNIKWQKRFKIKRVTNN